MIQNVYQLQQLPIVLLGRLRLVLLELDLVLLDFELRVNRDSLLLLDFGDPTLGGNQEQIVFNLLLENLEEDFPLIPEVELVLIVDAINVETDHLFLQMFLDQLVL